ncbi:MAG: hypothetical protein OQL06_11070 [Gammaproteobacteria bacterium]|nr:hypothetical protein [Gammaproteobacteria bacterium]
MKRIYLNSLITVLVMTLVVLMHTGYVDEIGERYTEQGLKRALITYGVARGLNGVISVAQGTEVAVEPVGVGLTFAPGQILDPVNDLIERFSWIVMASGASLGMQRILIQMTAWLWFSVLVSVVLIAALLMLWKKPQISKTVRDGVFRLAMVLLVIRLAIPLIAVINEGIYLAFLKPQYESSQMALQRTADNIHQLNESTPTPTDTKDWSFIDSLKSIYQSASDSVDVQSKLDALKQTAADTSEYVLDMIVVFLLQTIIFPLLFLWLAIKLIKSIITIKF